MGLTISAYSVDDICDEHIGWLNDKTLMRHSEQRHRDHTVETQREYVAGFVGTPNYLWAVRDGDRLVGTATAYRDGDSSDIGILIGVPGHGYGVQACRLVRDWLFAHTDVARVTGGTRKENGAMVKVYTGAGLMQVREEDGYLFFALSRLAYGSAMRRLCN